MEQEIFGEQPNKSTVQTVATDVDKGTDLSEGSPLGKFKNADALYDAYNELQSEFTRKCQKLSETEKKLQDLNSQNAGENEKNDNEFAWKNNLDEFLQSHKNASSLIEEITQEMIENEELCSNDDGLEKAYYKVMEKKYSSWDDLAKNPDFLDKYIYTNDNIKNKIIKEYVDTLQKTQSPVNIIGGGYGGIASTNTFTTLEDANKYVENMFKF